MQGRVVLALLLGVVWQAALGHAARASGDMATKSTKEDGFAVEWPGMEMDDDKAVAAVKDSAGGLGESGKMVDSTLDSDAFAEDWPVVELGPDSMGEERESMQDKVNAHVASALNGGVETNHTDFTQQGYPVVKGARPGGSQMGYLPKGYNAGKPKAQSWAEYQAASQRLKKAKETHASWREKRLNIEAVSSSGIKVSPAEANAIGNSSTAVTPEPDIPSSSGIGPDEKTTDTIAHAPKGEMGEAIQSDIAWLQEHVNTAHSNKGDDDVTLMY